MRKAVLALVGIVSVVFTFPGIAKAQTWSTPQFVTNGNAVALATNGKGTSAILFWVTGPGLMATVGINGVWSTPATLSTATSVGHVAVAPNGDVVAAWSFHTNKHHDTHRIAGCLLQWRQMGKHNHPHHRGVCDPIE